MKARNLDQNTVYFPKVDSERIEKKKSCFIKTRNPFLDLKRLFFCKGGKLCCNDKIRECFYFFSPFVWKHFI